MLMYKGFRCWYLGLGRWAVHTPDSTIFDIKISVNDLIERIDKHWRKIWG